MAQTDSMRATTAETVGQAFQATATAFAGASALRTPDGAIDITWDDYAQRVREVAAGLAGLGLQRGDIVACWLSNRPEFHIADAAAMHLGAASFSVYPTYTAEQAEHVIGDAGARILITEPQFLERALAVRDSGRTAVEPVVVLDDSADAETLAWEELPGCAEPGFDFEARAAAVQPDDLLTLIYTSGTTGPPKGVQITHRNVMSLLASLSGRLGLPDGIRAISWLPMAHVAERLCTHYFPIVHGWSVTTCSNPKAIAGLIPEVRPEFFFSPPRLWEKLRAGVLASSGDIPEGDAAAAALRAIGFDALGVAIVGAAPCPPEVVRFWHALGVRLCEVYGMSETTGVATVNPPDAVRIGTVGPPLPNVEVRLGEADEVLVRGANVMRGYRNLPEKTAEALDAEGWLHTGDVGAFDDAGYLKIVDRIKEIIISAAGKNMSPANIEAELKTSGRLIGQACCIGDARPYNVALITLDPDAAAAFAAAHGIAPDAVTTDDVVRAEVAAEVEAANTRLARVEQIRKFTILPEDWVADGDELTPTMKLKRAAINAKYGTEIEALYAG